MIADRQRGNQYKPLLGDDGIDTKNKGNEFFSIFTGLTFPEVPNDQILPILRQNPPSTAIEDYIELSDSIETVRTLKVVNISLIFLFLINHVKNSYQIQMQVEFLTKMNRQ